MNYVGCKVSIALKQAKAKARFIWTMWDVKKKFIPQNAKPSERFYMNYVGCKANNKEKHKNMDTSFIWTMWDVKENTLIAFEKSCQVLYELCGM